MQSLATASPPELALLQGVVDDASLVLLDGFHAIKHAIRFGAELLVVITTGPDKLAELSRLLAPDIWERLLPRVRIAELAEVRRLIPGEAHWTGVWAVARKPNYRATEILASRAIGPIVLLENPNSLGNVGACIRVAAAANAGGVAILGAADPWGPAAIRGAAGLQFALPVFSIESLDDCTRAVVALDPDGEVLRPGMIPDFSLLAFGTEREGLSEALLARADLRLRIPMRAGVSSLNLAVSVGVVLYGK
jgi:TrmH family RNA methyltransferase